MALQHHRRMPSSILSPNSRADIGNGSTTTIETVRKRRRRSHCIRHRGATVLLVLGACCISFDLFSHHDQHMILHGAHAEEIVATNEWQRLGPNDTVPAGLHVKMDLSTGEKWAKTISDEDDDTDKLAVGADGEAAGVAEVSNDGALTIVPGSVSHDDNSGAMGGNDDEDKEPIWNKDYEMMHRVISNLPAEEIDRMGGLPALPNPENHTVPKLTADERAMFEARMEEIWTKRQKELADFQEEFGADLPKLLKARIATLRAYVDEPEEKLLELLEMDRIADENDDADEGEENANDVLGALRDLELQLTDVDMARDFHTLGGWPVLLSLLDDGVHRAPSRDGDIDGTITTKLAKIDAIQSIAAVCAGTAASNVGEFRLWAMEDVGAFLREVAPSSSSSTERVTVVSLLVDALAADLKRRAPPPGDTMSTGPASKPTNSRLTFKLRAAYALGALLRGNPSAQKYFVTETNHNYVGGGGVDGPSVLVRDALGSLSSVRGGDGAVTAKDWKFASKVLALGTDVVTEVLLHDNEGVSTEGAAIATYYATMDTFKIVGAFSSSRWCDLALRLLSAPSDAPGWIGLRERALASVTTIAARCQEVENNQEWGVRDVERVRKEWNREGSGDGLDPEYRRELLELADGVLEMMGSPRI